MPFARALCAGDWERAPATRRIVRRLSGIQPVADWGVVIYPECPFFKA